MKFGHYIPNHSGRIHGQVADDMVKNFAWCDDHGHSLTQWRGSSCSIDELRNQAVDRSLSQGLDYLLMQDDDVSSPYQVAIGRLYDSIVETGAAVMGAVVLTRRRSGVLNAFPARPGDVHPVERIGTGLILIDLAQIRHVKAPWFVTELSDDGTWVEQGEDFYFAKKVRAAGFNVYADFTFETEHAATRQLSTHDMIHNRPTVTTSTLGSWSATTDATRAVTVALETE